jgi:hypothetical protein
VYLWFWCNSSFTDGRCTGRFPLGLVTGNAESQVSAATGSGSSSFRGTIPNVPGVELNWLFLLTPSLFVFLAILTVACDLFGSGQLR